MDTYVSSSGLYHHHGRLVTHHDLHLGLQPRTHLKRVFCFAFVYIGSTPCQGGLLGYLRNWWRRGGAEGLESVCSGALGVLVALLHMRIDLCLHFVRAEFCKSELYLRICWHKVHS